VAVPDCSRSVCADRSRRGGLPVGYRLGRLPLAGDQVGHGAAGLSWYRVNAAAAFVVILAAGYGLEYVVAARTGRRALWRKDTHAEDR
jgi:hypothetical protein